MNAVCSHDPSFRRPASACLAVLLLALALVGATLVASPARAASGVAANTTTIDFSTYTSADPIAGGTFDPLFYRSEGIRFPAQRCGTDGCTSWFVGYVQGDQALVGSARFGQIKATFGRPVSGISVLAAPAFQGTGAYRLTAYDNSGATIAQKQVEVTQDDGNTSPPAPVQWGYFEVGLNDLSRPAKSFAFEGWMTHSSYPQNQVLEYGVSTIALTR